MNELEPIFVNGIRILSPHDYDIFVANIDKVFHRTLFDVALWSGMRYIEIQRLWDHPEWYQSARKNIHLPVGAVKKSKRKQLERNIMPIPPQIESIMPYFFAGKRPPTNKVFNENLKRWAVKAGFDPVGFSAKTTRKTIESWMVAAGVRINVVCLRQGHDELTSMRHYQGLSFTNDEKAEIKRRLAGWIE